jgi:glycosyltransferase involved in cell wall biosynthesis
MELTIESERERGRLLWLTDTYGDHNGVSTVLKAILHEIRLRDLPVDLLVCSHTVQAEDHLIVIKPVTEFTLPLYRQQAFRVPNYLSVHRTFRRGKYTRIICSTEGPMGLAALWLKKTCSVETFFYLHTDWLIFAKEVLSLEQTGLKRLQRVLRAYYKGFGNIFVLNTDHQQWLISKPMGFDPSRVFMTAHWAGQSFTGVSSRTGQVFPFDPEMPVVLYAGRISREKGVLELPGIIRMIRSVIPEVQMVVAGTGPAEKELKEAMPDAFYLGWIEPGTMPCLFKSADILLFPSRFDTFSCVVLEALTCGLPVIAYNTKGPKDILENSVSGYLVETDEEMAGKAVCFFLDPSGQPGMKMAAILRSQAYQSEEILDRLLMDAGLMIEPCAR